MKPLQVLKALKIQLREASTNEHLQTVIAAKLDATQIMTVVSISDSLKESDIIRFPYSIDRWDIVNGIVTIYYTNGLILEAERIHYYDVVKGLGIDNTAL